MQASEERAQLLMMMVPGLEGRKGANQPRGLICLSPCSASNRREKQQKAVHWSLIREGRVSQIKRSKWQVTYPQGGQNQEESGELGEGDWSGLSWSPRALLRGDEWGLSSLGLSYLGNHCGMGAPPVRDESKVGFEVQHPQHP